MAYARDLPEGHTLTINDLEPLSPGTGIGWPYAEHLVGATLARDVEGGTLVELEQLSGQWEMAG